MKNIKTTDYVSEYEFRRFSRPKYQTPTLRPMTQERRGVDAEKDEDRGNTAAEMESKDRYREVLQNTRLENTGIDHGEMRDGRFGRKKDGRSSLRFFEARDVDQNEDNTVYKGEKTGRKVPRIRTVGKGETESQGTNVQKKKSDWTGGLNGRKKRGKKDRKKNRKKPVKKSVTKVAGSLKSMITDLEKNANVSWDTDQRWDMDSAWDYARERGGVVKGFRKGIEEVIKVIVKVIKAVATTTLLPLLLIMAGSLFVIITVLSASTDISVTGTDGGNGIVNPSSEKQIIYNGLLETFNGNEIATLGVMCALMAESGCDPTATEAASKWGVSAAEYTAKVNDGTVTKEEFVNSTYNGIQGSRGYGIAQWSTVGRKTSLFEFAASWAEEHGKEFDIGNIDMQVAHLQETINTTYATLKQALIAGTDIEEACYLWIATYERPSERYSTWREKAKRDVQEYEAALRAECVTQAEGAQGYFIWPCPSSHRITSYFGNRTPPKQGASSNHKGIDIGASMGAQVIAAAAGTVTKVAYDSARGYYIIVNHGSGYETLYQHLNRQDVVVGDVVKQGEQIGAVGETGISTAPHLHFEVHVNGTPVDPTKYVE